MKIPENLIREALAKEFQEAGCDSERNAEIELWDTLTGEESLED